MPSLRLPALSIGLIAVFLTAVGPLLHAECAPYWRKSQAVQVGGQLLIPGGAVTADFDGDGVPDVATLVSNSGVWTLLTNATSRQLGSPTQILARSGLIGLEAEDVTGDDEADLIVLERTGTALLTFAGAGDGTFASPVSTPLSTEPAAFASGDFNGDSFRDVAVRHADATTVSIWLGSSSGAFAAGESTSAPAPLGRLVVTDFTGDDLDDVLAARTDLHGLLLFSGNGDGTLDDPIEVSDGEVIALAAADLDADGDADVITTSDASASMSVHLNQGDGTFAAPTPYTTQFHWYVTYTGKVADLVVGNVTSDDVPDVVLSLVPDGLIATFVGTGDGAFADARFDFAERDSKKDSPRSPLLADVDGDARLDLLYRGAADVVLAPNNCGDVALTTTVLTPVVSVGDPVRVEVDLRHSTGFDISGDVSIFESAEELASGTTNAEIELPILPEGTHTLHSAFAGDNFFHPAVSEAVTARVTSDTTAATLALAEWAELPLRYGATPTLETTVTSTIAGTPTGTLEVYFDGASVGTVPCCEGFAAAPLPVGTHEYRVRYLGDSTFPPSPLSGPLTLNVERAPSSIYFEAPSVARAGDLITIKANADAPGTMKVFDGGTVIGSITTSSEKAWLTFQVALPPGNHQLTARFDGGPNYLPSEATSEHNVIAMPGVLALDAHAHGSSIHVTWMTTMPNLNKWWLERWVNGEWQLVAGPINAYSYNLTITDADPNTTYVFRMFVTDWSGNTFGPSIDAASVGTFVDETLTPGVTNVKSQHFTDVLDGINRLRAASAGSPLSMPGLAAGNLIRYVDLTTLRQKANEARRAVGMQEYPFTDRGTSRTILIRDIEELRHAVR